MRQLPLAVILQESALLPFNRCNRYPGQVQVSAIGSSTGPNRSTNEVGEESRCLEVEVDPEQAGRRQARRPERQLAGDYRSMCLPGFTRMPNWKEFP